MASSKARDKCLIFYINEIKLNGEIVWLIHFLYIAIGCDDNNFNVKRNTVYLN